MCNDHYVGCSMILGQTDQIFKIRYLYYKRRLLHNYILSSGLFVVTFGIKNYYNTDRVQHTSFVSRLVLFFTD